MEINPVVIKADPSIEFVTLTAQGQASGPLVWANLEMIATAAGWALPPMRGAILLIESATTSPIGDRHDRYRRRFPPTHL